MKINYLLSLLALFDSIYGKVSRCANIHAFVMVSDARLDAILTAINQNCIAHYFADCAGEWIQQVYEIDGPELGRELAQGVYQAWYSKRAGFMDNKQERFYKEHSLCDVCMNYLVYWYISRGGKPGLEDMTAIADIAQERVDALYPNEGYDLRSRTFKTTNITDTDIGSSGATSGAVRVQSFFSLFIPTVWGMPTLEELKKVFLEELAQGKITPPTTVAPEESSTVTSTDTSEHIQTYLPSPFLLILYISIFAIVLCVAYFYLISLCVGIAHVINWIHTFLH